MPVSLDVEALTKKVIELPWGKLGRSIVMGGSIWFRTCILNWEFVREAVPEGSHNLNCERPWGWDFYFVPKILRVTESFSSWLKQIVKILRFNPQWILIENTEKWKGNLQNGKSPLPDHIDPMPEETSTRQVCVASWGLGISTREGQAKLLSQQHWVRQSRESSRITRSLEVC